MNRSGYAARCLVERHGFAPEESLVVFDEVQLPLGRLRLRRSGSPGGHRGMESILENLRTDQVPRLRLGVAGADGPPPGEDLADFVLAPFTAEEKRPPRDGRPRRRRLRGLARRRAGGGDGYVQPVSALAFSARMCTILQLPSHGPAPPRAAGPHLILSVPREAGPLKAIGRSVSTHAHVRADFRRRSSSVRRGGRRPDRRVQADDHRRGHRSRQGGELGPAQARLSDRQDERGQVRPALHLRARTARARCPRSSTACARTTRSCAT